MKPRILILTFILLSAIIPFQMSDSKADISIIEFTAERTTVRIGETVRFNVTISNDETQDRYLVFPIYKDDNIFEAFNVKVPGYNSTISMDFNYRPDEEELGTHIFKAIYEGSSASIVMEVIGPDITIINMTSMTDNIPPGTPLTISVEIQNNEDRDLHDIWATLIYNDGQDSKSSKFDIYKGEYVGVFFFINVPDGCYPGPYTLTVKVFELERSMNVTVIEKAVFSIYQLTPGYDEEFEVKDTVTIRLNVTNYGNVASEELPLILLFEGEPVIKNIRLSPIPKGSTKEVKIKWQIPQNIDSGKYELLVHIIDDNIVYEHEFHINIYNPLGGTPVYYYALTFLIPLLIIGAILVALLFSFKRSRNNTKRGPI